MEYTIYADKLDDTRAALDKLARKAKKYNVPFSYTVGEEHPATVDILDYDEFGHCLVKVDTYTAAAVDISIDCDGFVKKDGWTVCAHIEHGCGGNIVTPLNGQEAPAEWFHVPPHCDHCKSNRFRKVTYMCVDGNGELKQAGSTCLKDYTGINPAAALMWAEVKDIMPTVGGCTRKEWERHPRAVMYDVETVLGLAVDEIAAHGYRKADMQDSTKAYVMTALADRDTPTPDGLEKARLIIDWLKRFIGDDAEPCGNLEENAAIIAQGGYVKKTHVGRLVYIPRAYDGYMERKAKEAARKEKEAVSEYVGVVKDRLTIKTATAALLTSWDTDFGTTYLYKFTDTAGNIYIWKASKPVTLTDGMTIKGTVKEHSEYNGVKQTILTRCKVA